MSLKHYYEKELSKLYDEAHRFSQDYPEQAASLNLERNKTHDPHVQRLLEGCAFLTAKIYQMADDEADHLPEQLIQRLWPQLAEGFPSVTMVQAIVSDSLSKGHLIPRGTLLQTGLVGDEKTSCKFTTTADMTIAGIVIDEVTHNVGKTQTLSISLRAPNGWESLEIDALPLYVDSNSVLSFSIVHFLMEGAKNLEVYADDVCLNASSITLNFLALQPEGCLNQDLPTGLYAQQILFEYFACPEKLNLVEIAGLLSLNLPEKTQSLKFVFHDHARIQRTHQITRDQFKLFVTPAINKYHQDCEPLSLDHKHHRYHLSCDHKRRQSVQILSVLCVHATVDANLKTFEYTPLHTTRNMEDSHYVVQREIKKNNLTDTYLSFNSSHVQKETISVKAAVCNAHYPRKEMRVGPIGFYDRKHESACRLTNIQQPSAYLAPVKQGLSKQLLKQLRVLVEDIQSVEHLKTLLTLMNRGDNPQSEQRIESIVSVSAYTKALVKRGIFYRVQGIKIELSESGFSSLSDAYCFSSVLHAFFKASAMIGTVIETSVVCQPSEETFTWLGI